MKWKDYIISVILLLLNTELEAYQTCYNRQARLKSILRGNYQNALNYNREALISSKLQNGFAGGISGSSLRDNIYSITGGFGFTASGFGFSVIFELQQQYELNTLKIWLWDQDNRFYRIKVYLIYNDIETQIYESNFAQTILTITFPNQQVQKFKIQQFQLINNKPSKQLYLMQMGIQIKFKLLSYLQFWTSYYKNRSFLQTLNKNLR